MALYSVWDWDRNAYRVYATDTPVSVGDDPKPPKPANVGPIGADPDTDVKPLPAGARLIGYEHLPRGEIRRLLNPVSGVSGDDDAGASIWSNPLVMFVAGVAATVAYFNWSKR